MSGANRGGADGESRQGRATEEEGQGGVAMPQVRVLGKGARITGGIFCLLFALHTWIWVLRDFLELDPGPTWKVWTGAFALGAGADDLGHIPATTPDDVGLGLLQLAAVFAAFTGAWTAGGLTAVTAVLTLAWRLPVIWHAGLHSESSQQYALRGFADDPSIVAALVGCVFAVILCAVLGIVLMAGIRPWTGRPGAGAPHGTAPPPYGQQPYGAPTPGQPQPQPQHGLPHEPVLPGESPQRPTGAHAAVAAAFLGVLALFCVGWNVQAVYTAGGGYWLRLLTGEGTVFTLLDVSSGWTWLTLILAGGTGAVLAVARTVSARGFSLGLAIALLPQAVTVLWSYIDAGTFFELGEVAPVSGAFSRLQLLITLAGAVTLIVLTLRPGVPARPGTAGMPGGPMAAAPMPGAAMPGAMPGGAMQGGPAPFGAPPGQVPQAQPQPYFPPQPGPGPTGPAGPTGPTGPVAPPGPAYAPPPAQPADPPSQGGTDGHTGGEKGADGSGATGGKREEPGGGAFGPPPVY
jgi:hypothetical protein